MYSLLTIESTKRLSGLMKLIDIHFRHLASNLQIDILQDIIGQLLLLLLLNILVRLAISKEPTVLL